MQIYYCGVYDQDRHESLPRILRIAAHGFRCPLPWRKPGRRHSADDEPPRDTKAPSESVIAWQTGGFVHGDLLDIGCGLGDDAVYLANNGHTVTGLDISPTALITAERRAKDAGVDVKFAVADSTKLGGYTDAFDTVIDIGMSSH